MALQRGDNDNKNIWNGSRGGRAPAYTVRQLQTDLKAVGTLSGRIDGDFGKNTERALKIFQWCLKNASQILDNGNLIEHRPIKNITVSGVLDSATHGMATHWSDANNRVSGDLVRMPSTDLSNIKLGSFFKNVGLPQVTKTQFLISSEAIAMVLLMDKKAGELGLTISLNQTFRKHGVKVTGAVVPPATKSQHLIGHAIDCNIVDGNRFNTSRDFKSNRQTDGAKAFIAAIKAGGYRWGGDFRRPDTPHFDARINADLFDYDAKFYVNQKQLGLSEPIAVYAIR